jgi:hypothetical protein
MRIKFDVEEYVKENPHVWAKFKEYAMAAKLSGRPYFSARTIVERIRWDTVVTEKNSDFKIANHVSPYLGRKLMKENSEFAGFFRTKVLEVDLQEAAA